MKYLALIYADEAAWQTFSPEEQAAAYAQYGAFAEEARQAGVMVGGEELDGTATATTVRVRGDETLVTDGPFVELKEALGGYFVFECDSLDDACAWAAKCPGAEHGTIEVRPVYDDEGGPS
jgi:hypothetical protein